MKGFRVQGLEILRTVNGSGIGFRAFKLQAYGL